MAAGVYNFIIDQGSSFSQQLTVKESGSPKDLTGYSARSQLRPTKTSEILTATFTCTIPEPTAGVIYMRLTPTQTAAITAGRYYYDIEIFSGGEETVTRLLQGEVTVTPEVTR